VKTLTAFIVLSALFSPGVAWAFQSHPAPEGLYAHQLAHVFFSVAMGILAYWLQVNSFVQQKGWRLIQISCILFILWNIDTFFGHWVEERVAADAVIGEPDWTQRIILDSQMTRLYYVLKLDHFVSVPAIICLFLGIRSLYKYALKEGGHARE
jgi:lipid-A-disaccharide synthase-like uncharacterized protein